MPIIGTLPNNITNGQTVDANPVMADFNFIVNQVNANGNPAGTLTAPSGTSMLFQQSSAPLGWVAQTTVAYQDSLMHLTTPSTYVGVTGTNGAKQFLQSQWASDGHALTTAELATHSHSDAGHTHAINEGAGHSHGAGGGNSFLVTGGGNTISAGSFAFQAQATTANAFTNLTIVSGNANIQNTGSGTAHSHTATFNITMVDHIIAVKS